MTTQTIIKATVLLALAGAVSGALAMSEREQAIADRIAPKGQVCVQGDPSCDPAAAPQDSAQSPAVPPQQAVAAGDASAGEDLPATAEAAAEAADEVSSQLVASSARSGETVYNGACVACHAVGVAGAPKLADPAGWEGRLDKGIDTLVGHVVNGYNAMPAMGACMDCSDEEIRLAVEYMLGTL